MIAQDVIEKVDRLKPNAYSTEDKLDWISDVDTGMRTEIVKLYNYVTINTAIGEVTYDLPSGVSFENIEHVLYGHKRVNKVDFRSFGINGYSSKITIKSTVPETIMLVYLVSIPRYRYIEYISGTGSITFGSNFIEAIGKEFTLMVGDAIVVSGCTANPANNRQASIKGGTSSKLEFAANTFIAGNEPGVITIKRVLNDELIAKAPYDKMYKEYLFSMIDFNNREYESYNNNMAMYNATLESFSKWYKQRSPINADTKIYNIW